jgi:hypothetical protein
MAAHSIGLARSRRTREVRARTIDVSRLPRSVIAKGAELYPEAVDGHPVTRGDCANVARPCPYVSCRWHLYLDVSPTTGSIKLNFPDLEVDELPVSCALDAADRGVSTLEETGEIMNLTRERVRQIESVAKKRILPLLPRGLL